MVVEPHRIALLDEEMGNSERIVRLVRDDEVFAGELYGALCNMGWCKMPDDKQERVVFLLKGRPIPNGDDTRAWSCSWRTSGGIVASLRNKTVGRDDDYEDYMDWYCYGGEGEVSDRVEAELLALGWLPAPWIKD